MHLTCCNVLDRWFLVRNPGSQFVAARFAAAHSRPLYYLWYLDTIFENNHRRIKRCARDAFIHCKCLTISHRNERVRVLRRRDLSQSWTPCCRDRIILCTIKRKESNAYTHAINTIGVRGRIYRRWRWRKIRIGSKVVISSGRASYTGDSCPVLDGRTGCRCERRRCALRSAVGWLLVAVGWLENKGAVDRSATDDVSATVTARLIPTTVTTRSRRDDAGIT